MKLIALMALLLALSAAGFAQEKAFRVVGYLPDYRVAGFEAKAAVGVTDLVVFSLEPKADGTLDLSRLKKVEWEKFRTWKKDHKARLWVAIGGWERSAHFGAVTTDAEKRATLVKALHTLMKQEQIDGLDLDWKHPKNEAEQNGYAALMADLRQAFATDKMQLSVTMAAWQQLPKKAFESLDWVNIMAYDHPGDHSTFAGAKKDVEKLIEMGAPKAKLTLGMPFYGRNLKKPDQALSYKELTEKYKLTPDQDTVDGFFFNGPKLIEQKTRYALTQGLGGVMFWELGHDAPGEASLLKVIRQTIASKH